MPSPPTIAVLGSINLDFVIRTARLPVAGETISGGTFMTTPGGKGGNQALAARRLGAAVTLNACVGEDPFADAALKTLEEEGVDLSGVQTAAPTATGAAFINVDDNGENQIAVASGANSAFTPDRAPQINADWIIGQLEVAPETLLAAAKKTQAKLCLNAAPAKRLPPELLARADLLIVNEIEADFYAGELTGFSGIVAQTLGASGAMLTQGGREIARSSAPRVDVVDTTGAGDSFVAALTVFLAEGRNAEEALMLACHAGALATTKLGAQAASPDKATLKAAFPHLPL